MGRSYVETCTDVHISEFDDDTVLERALEIIQEHRKEKEPAEKGRHLDAWLIQHLAIESIAKELGMPVCEDVLPSSTAGRIRTIDELKAEIARHWS